MRGTQSDYLPDLLRGNTEALLLFLVVKMGHTYGYQLIKEIGRRSEGFFHFKEGTVYPALRKLENDGLLQGEWQEMEAVMVGNRVTVTLNGQRIHDDVLIEGITGGALDAAETEPGPIMIQGDHTGVWFRKLIVTPITSR